MLLFSEIILRLKKAAKPVVITDTQQITEVITTMEVTWIYQFISYAGNLSPKLAAKQKRVTSVQYNIYTST